MEEFLHGQRPIQIGEAEKEEFQEDPRLVRPAEASRRLQLRRHAQHADEVGRLEAVGPGRPVGPPFLGEICPLTPHPEA